MLFPKAAEGFEELVGYVERLVDLFHRDLAEDLERLATIADEGDFQKSDETFYLDSSILEKLADGLAEHQAAYLVDMAKVEALDGRILGRRLAGRSTRASRQDLCASMFAQPAVSGASVTMPAFPGFATLLLVRRRGDRLCQRTKT